jgi:alkylation response protein AidB-like acyl-CoA dehydrogenase
VRLDLGFNDEQEELATSVRGLCERMGTGQDFTEHEPLPGPFWSGLAELGVLGLGTESMGGGTLEIAAAMEQLGARAAPGPLVGCFVAGVLLPDDEFAPVAEGEILVSVGRAGLFPWAPRAGLFIELDEDSAWLGTPIGEIDPVDTTAGEPWGRVELSRERHLGDPGLAVARGDTALAAYLVGAADHLLSISVEYAKDRHQFGKPIGGFQAVAHPLAESFVALGAARTLTRAAAFRLDQGDGTGLAASAVARLSATRAALQTTYRAHQVFGAMGFTIEGPVAHLGHRIRQLGLLAPGPTAARARVLADLLT